MTELTRLIYRISGMKTRLFTIDVKVVRHIRTPEGMRRFHGAIGDVIGSHGKFEHLESLEPHYADWERVSAPDGSTFEVGQDGGKWVATPEGVWSPVVSASSEQGVYEALDKHAATLGKTKEPKAPASPKKTPKKPTGKAGDPGPKKYKKVGQAVDVENENLDIDISGGTPEQRRVKIPKPGTRTIRRFEPGDKNYEELRARFVIPPKYQTFWINESRDENAPDSNYDGLVYMGLDPTTGKEQSVYSSRYRILRDIEKHGGGANGGDDGDLAKVPELLQNRDRIIKELTKDAKSGNPQAQALLVQALTGMRIGTTKRAGEKESERSYGAHSLQARHITVNQGSVRFSFMGKGNHKEGRPNPAKGGKDIWPGKPYTVTSRDKVLVDMMKEALKSKSRYDQLFDTSASKVNGYLDDVEERLGLSGNLSAHNFRHAKATLLAMSEIQKHREPKTEIEFKKFRKEVATSVGKVINDTPSVAHGSYIMPSVWEAWLKRHPEWRDVKF